MVTEVLWVTINLHISSALHSISILKTLVIRRIKNEGFA